MSAAELILRANQAGITLELRPDGRLLLRADNPPPPDLLAVLTACRGEVISSLSLVTPPFSTLLTRVARLLGVRAAELLEGKHLDPHDLVELTTFDAERVAYWISRTPAWIDRAQRSERSAEITIEPQNSEIQHMVLTAATASAAWRSADGAYINHRMSCPVCRGPTIRHCPTGEGLRHSYDNTPMEPTT